MPIIQLENGDKLQFDDSYSEKQIGEAVDEYMAGKVQPIAPQEEAKPQAQEQESQAPRRNFGHDIGLGARAVLQAAASPVTLIGDLTTMGANKLGGTKTKLPSQVVSEGLTSVGLPEPATAGERIGSNIIEGATGSGLVSKAVKNAATRTPALIQKFSSKTPAVDAAIGSGAAGASSIANEAGAGPAAQIGAGIGAGLLAGKIAKPKVTQITADQIQDASRDLYKVAEEKGGMMNPTFTGKFLDIAEQAKPKMIAGKIHTSEDKKFINSIDEFKDLKGSNLTLDDAERIDQALGDKIDSLLENNGKIGNNARKMIDVQRQFRGAVDDLKDNEVIGGKEGLEASKQARHLWSRASKLRDVEKIITRAELTDNPTTSLKTGFRNLYISDPKMRGFTADEKELIKKAAQSGAPTDFLKSMGSRLIPIGSMVSGGLPSAAMAQVGSMASRGAATQLQLNRANKLANAIANKALPRAEEPKTYPLIPLSIGNKHKENKK